jgi:N utilization substance protein B
VSLSPTALRQAREAALQMLYSWEMSGSDLPDAIASVQSLQLRLPDPSRDRLAVELARGTALNLARIDPLIADAAKNWRIERLAILDRLVLRLATFELLERPEVPAAAVINEALELARGFSGPEAVRFVNGVLDAIRRRLEEERANPAAAGPGGAEPDA